MFQGGQQEKTKQEKEAINKKLKKHLTSKAKRGIIKASRGNPLNNRQR